MARTEILVAVRPNLVDEAGEALEELNIPLVYTHTLADACGKLHSGRFRLVLGTLQFDDSRLFDLLPSARASGTPLVVMRLTASQLPDSVIDAFFRAAQLLGFQGWIDVYRLSKGQGKAQALANLRELVMATALKS
jgi:hypothetical protein